MRIGVLEAAMARSWFSRGEPNVTVLMNWVSLAAWIGLEQIAHPMRVLAWPVIFDSVNNAIVSLPCAVGVRGIAVKCGHRYA